MSLKNGAARWIGAPIGLWLDAGTYWAWVEHGTTTDYPQIARDNVESGSDPTLDTSYNSVVEDYGMGSAVAPSGYAYSIRISVLS